MSSVESDPESTIRSSATPSGLFARSATGLVRGVSQRSSFVINFIPGHPTQALAAGFFFVFALFPGGNYLVGLALTIPLILAIAYSFGLLPPMIPPPARHSLSLPRLLH